MYRVRFLPAVYRFLFCAGLLIQGVASAHGQEAPTRILIVGDSIMQAVSRSLERQLGRRPGFQAASYTHIGSGLARMDLFDWHEQISGLMEERRPELVLIMMGANDNQPMRVSGDTILRVGTDEWKQEYARRVGGAMEIMLSGGATQVHWLELPDMRDARLQEDVGMINQLVRAEAARRLGVTFQETRSLLSRTVGQYSPYVIQANGMPLDIRSGDGIHLNRQGADLLADHIVRRIWGD